MTENSNSNLNALGALEDRAAISGLTTAIQMILPALARFIEFEKPEQTAAQRATWSAQLDEPLPRQGVGQEAVLTLLRDVAIPNGLHIGASGFSGWVATMPTTVPTAAGLAAAVAGSSYMCVQAFNVLEELAFDAPLASQFDDMGYLYMHFGVEQTAPSRGAQVWAILKEIGVEGLKERIRRHNRYARHLAERVRSSPYLELVAPMTLSICCFRYVPESLRGRNDSEAMEKLNWLNRAVLGRVRARGRCIPSATTVRGAFAIRPCYINPRTTLADVDALADEVEACGNELWAAHV